MQITIRNWDEYNPRRDQKTFTWFRLENGIATDAKLFGLSAEQKFCWICLLCEASKRGSSTITVYSDWLSHNTGIKKSIIEETIKILNDRGILDIVRTDPCESVRVRTEMCSTDVTDVTDVRTSPTAPDKPKFNFNALYLNYPRREKKSPFMERVGRLIKTEEEYSELSKAIENYSVRKKGTDPKFIMLPTTFLSEWRDWLDPNHGKATPEKDTKRDEFLAAIMGK